MQDRLLPIGREQGHSPASVTDRGPTDQRASCPRRPTSLPGPATPGHNVHSQGKVGRNSTCSSELSAGEGRPRRRKVTTGGGRNTGQGLTAGPTGAWGLFLSLPFQWSTASFKGLLGLKLQHIIKLAMLIRVKFRVGCLVRDKTGKKC